MNWLKQNIDIAGLILKWLVISGILIGTISTATAYAIQTNQLIKKVDSLEAQFAQCTNYHQELILEITKMNEIKELLIEYFKNRGHEHTLPDYPTGE